METKLIRKLTEGQNFYVKVIAIQNHAGEFPSKNNPGQMMKCHWITIEYKEFPECVIVQICNEFEKISVFAVGDTIEITARAYSMGKAMQSVAFVRVIPKKEQLQNLLNTPMVDRQNNVPAVFESTQGIVNMNPMIHGTLLANSMYCAAVALQGSKKIDRDTVQETIQSFFDFGVEALRSV